MVKPKPSTQALHLKPSRGAVLRVNNLIRAASAYDWRGAGDPDDYEIVTENYKRTHARFLRFLADLEHKANQK